MASILRLELKAFFCILSFNNFQRKPCKGFQLSRDIDQTVSNVLQQIQQASEGSFALMGLSPLTAFVPVFHSRLSQHHSLVDTHLEPGPLIAHVHTACLP